MVALYYSPPVSGNNFTIIMTDYCQKKYKKIIKKDVELENCINHFMDELSTNPYIGEKLLVNFPGMRSIHCRKNRYRIVYRVVDDTKKIEILEIGHRKDCYSSLAKALGSGV